MPRYFFDTQNGEFSGDEDGTKCASLGDARKLALRALADLARDNIPSGHVTELSVWVRDEKQNRLLKVSAHVDVE